MPRCTGLPTGPCPNGRNDSSVRNGEGDLMLCPDCDSTRHKEWLASRSDKSTTSSTVSSKKTNAELTRNDDDSKTNTERRRLFDEANKRSLPFSATGQCSTSDGSKASTASKSSEHGNPKSTEQTDVAATALRSVFTESRVSVVVSEFDRNDELRSLKVIIWNELLAYVCHYRDKSNVDALRRVVLGFYSAEDICNAKKLLVQEFRPSVGACPFLTERRNSTTRLAHEAEFDDILGIFDAMDAQNGLSTCLFAASNFDQVPKYGPEELNIGAVVDRQVRMETTLQCLTTSVSQLKPSSDEIQDKPSVALEIQQELDRFNAKINQTLDHMSTVCSKLAEKVEANVTVSSSASRDLQVADRSMNIVLFGVAENRDATVWRQAVDDALCHVMGRTVDVADMFRIGRFTASKTRPVIVKLRTVWDRRIILSNCKRLKDIDSRIFIVPDESPEVRRKRVLQRIQSRAESDGKLTVVVDGVLLVDNVPVFSLKDGKLPQNA